MDLITEGGVTVTAAVPSGASTGVHEAVFAGFQSLIKVNARFQHSDSDPRQACELRDGDKGRYLGKGVPRHRRLGNKPKLSHGPMRKR